MFQVDESQDVISVAVEAEPAVLISSSNYCGGGGGGGDICSSPLAKTI